LQKVPITLVMSALPSISISGSPIGWISVKLILGTSTKICRETQNLVKIGQEYQALHMKTHLHFIVHGDINSHTNAFLCNTKYLYIGDM
jgi:hypothetical protein